MISQCPLCYHSEAHLQCSTQSEQCYNLEDKQTNTAKFDWRVYNVGSYGEIEHSLSDHACVYGSGSGYLATLVPLGFIEYTL